LQIANSNKLIQIINSDNDSQGYAVKASHDDDEQSMFFPKIVLKEIYDLVSITYKL